MCNGSFNSGISADAFALADGFDNAFATPLNSGLGWNGSATSPFIATSSSNSCSCFRQGFQQGFQRGYTQGYRQGFADGRNSITGGCCGTL